ncbi:MAG: MobQ family relaxase [Pseudomonadota bacterium]
MASFLCQVQTVQRALGRSAVAAAAYRSASRLVDERLAMEFDFSQKDGVEHCEIMAPDTAPEALQDRATLWNAAEASEQRKDAVPARELLLALPHELDFEQRRDLVRAFAAEQLVAKGMVVDIAMHRPGKEGDQRNFHAHLMVTTRRVGPAGFGSKDRTWRTPEQVRDWRAAWAKIQNEHLRRHLGPEAPQVSHLSLAERGVDREPTVHLGPAATALERKNVASERGEQNREVKAKNRKVRELHVDLEETVERIARREPEVLAPVAKLVLDAETIRANMIRERDGWEAERAAITAPRPPSVKAIEREVVGEAASLRRRALVRLQQTEERAKKVRSRAFELVRWVRNPARMIWAKHAEMNAIARARRDLRRAELGVQVRQAWLVSPAGQSYVTARRRPALDAAAEAATARRTLERKIKRMDKRIAAASRTYNDLRVAQALGQTSLKVPRTSPDATRFFRDVGAAGRAALQQYPAQARQQAVERLNRSPGRALGQTLFPGS